MNKTLNETELADFDRDADYWDSPRYRADISTGGAVKGFDFGKLPPILRTLLLSDGTVTKFLEAYYWEPIQIKRLFHRDGKAEVDLPTIDIAKGSPVLHRRILVCGIETGRIYSHAESYIRTDLLWAGVGDDLAQGQRGIGELMREKRVATFREHLTYELVAADELASDLGTSEDELLVSRSYRIFVNRTPCLYIIDKFPISHFS